MNNLFSSLYKKDSILLLLLLIFFIKEMVLSAIVQVWHTPDEQAHFAQVAYFAESHKMPGARFDLNKEIYISEELLGTLRDKQGNNKFTYRPNYNIEYTDGLTGKYEDEIKNLPKDYRKEFVKQEAAQYPPLYYWIAAIPYKVFYSTDLIFRVYASRFMSIIMGIATIFIAYLIGKQLFKKNRLLQITLPLLVSFHPMFSFVVVGVTSDNLLNLLFTAAIYINVLIITKGIKLKYIVWSLIVVVLLYLTKPQFILVFPLIAFALVAAFLQSANFSRRFKLVASISTIGILLGFILSVLLTPIYQVLEKIYPMSFSPGQSKFNIDPLWFIKDTITRTARETVPWYFGVFKWLGVVYPIEILRILNRLLIILGFGIVLKLGMDIFKRKIDVLFLFMLFIAVSYYIGIVFYNFLFYSSVNFSFGLQGRYFFPVILAHMALLLYGITTLIPERFKRLNGGGIKILGVSMIILNLIAIGILINSYYEWDNFNILVLQMSQYKPFYFKGIWLIFWLFIALISLLFLLFNYSKVRTLNENK